jgi:hypothetical protein
MKTFLLWAVGVLALEVLLLWEYFAVVGDGRMVSTNVVLALLVVTVSVVWLGFDSGFGRTLMRLLLALVGCIILTYAALVVAGPLWEVPVALVCDRGGQNVEVSSTVRGGYFEEHRIGPCVTYTHKSRPTPTGGGD